MNSQRVVQGTFAAAAARLLGRRRRREAMTPQLATATACSVHTLYGAFSVRSHYVAVAVQRAFGGFVYRPWTPR